MAEKLDLFTPPNYEFKKNRKGKLLWIWHYLCSSSNAKFRLPLSGGLPFKEWDKTRRQHEHDVPQNNSEKWNQGFISAKVLKETFVYLSKSSFKLSNWQQPPIGCIVNAFKTEYYSINLWANQEGSTFVLPKKWKF